MKPKSSRDELFFWCSRLNIPPDEFFRVPYAELEDKFRTWKSMQNLEKLKNRKLQFIRDYAINNLQPRSKAGLDPQCSPGGSSEPRSEGGSNPQCTPGCSSEEGYQGVLQAKVSLKDEKKKQQHNLDVKANTKLQGIDENQLMDILGTPGSPDVRINRVQMKVNEVGCNETREFNIYRGGNGNLQVDCPDEWEEFITNL